MKYFPSNEETMVKQPLQSQVFGHRMTPNQSINEYLLEFLQVMISPKELQKINGKEITEDYFPIDEDIKFYPILFHPQPRIGVRRFIFLNKSKEEGRLPVDKLAYKDCICALEEKITIDSKYDFLDKEYAINMIENLLYGFNAVIKNRSWFAQSLLPMCPELILPEAMGDKKKRSAIKYNNELDKGKIDKEFEFNRYNFMARGGEVYYLHILKSINDYPQYKNKIEEGFSTMIKSFPQFSKLTRFIEKAWDNKHEGEKKTVTKTLGAIPTGFDRREEYTAIELTNFLNSSMHPFEKIDVLAYGTILQMLRMLHEQACHIIEKPNPVWILDMKFKGIANEEVKKLAIKYHAQYEDDIIQALYKHLSDNKNHEIDQKEELSIITSAAKDTYKLYRKLGKEIGIITPLTGPGMRFTLSEKIVKFLVLSIIPPNTMITFDTFLDKLYEHYKIVIDRKHFKRAIAAKSVENINDLSFLDKNKQVLQMILKDCGFLRDLSDSTSIVENPYH